MQIDLKYCIVLDKKTKPKQNTHKTNTNKNPENIQTNKRGGRGQGQKPNH